jgi:hypothetical protein
MIDRVAENNCSGMSAGQEGPGHSVSVSQDDYSVHVIGHDNEGVQINAMIMRRQVIRGLLHDRAHFCRDGFQTRPYMNPDPYATRRPFCCAADVARQRVRLTSVQLTTVDVVLPPVCM